MSLEILTLPLGPLDTNCFVAVHAADGGPVHCWVFDPGMWPEPLLELLDQRGLVPERICLTHGHGDHLGGVTPVKERWPEAVFCCPAGDLDMLHDARANMSAAFLQNVTAPAADEVLQPGDELAMGALAWEVLDTSGHTPGGVSFYCRAEGVCITGDALFRMSIGRTDIPQGDSARLVSNIRTNLLTLPESTRIYPGHGPETTIGYEKANNPYVS